MWMPQKALPAQHPLGTGHELATGISTAVAEDMQINPTSSPLFWLQQLQTNFLQREKKKRLFSWTTHFSFSKAPVCLLGWEKSNREAQRGPPTSMQVPERLLKALPPTCSQPLVFHRLALPLESRYSAPQGHMADSPGQSISQHVEEMASMGQAVGMELLSPRRGCPANAPCPCSGGDNSSCGYGRFGSLSEAWKETATSDRTSWMPLSKGS